MPVVQSLFYKKPIDEFNHNRNRNVKNTPKGSYNCGGFALGTFSWYMPQYNTWAECETEANYRTYHCIRTMLEEFSDLRIIPHISCLAPDEYAIAFRISSDGDFHYLKRGRNGIWYSKLGSQEKITKHTDEYVFEEHWCDGRYGGPLVLFAKKL